MERTLEVRWFYEGDIPQTARDWFLALEPEKEGRREDVYVHPPHPALSVKLREGQVQVKRRGAGGGLIRFRPSVIGCMEHWHKWSFPVSGGAPREAVPSLNSCDTPPDTWLRVVKERYHHAFAPVEQARLMADVPREGAAPGEDAVHTEAELMRVTLGRRHWWTLCVETVGDAEALLRTLRPMGRHLFACGAPPTLETHRSHGYAKWLLTSARQRRASADARAIMLF